MQRYIEDDLIKWKDSDERMPLIIRGARQVGKSFIVEEFAKKNFNKLIVINFEFSPEYKECFSKLDPVEIIKKIEIMSSVGVTIGDTIVFLDEVQECPNAILSLRYFKEKMKKLHIIAAGSLLEMVINKPEFRMPVGRVQFLYMYPMNFQEFLLALGENKLVEYISGINLKDEKNENNVIHNKAMGLFKDYLLVGGMPEVVDAYVNSRSYVNAQNIQSALISSYKLDFGKYSKTTDIKYLEKVYERVSIVIAKEITYVDISREYQSRDLKRAIDLLKEARVVHKVMLNNAMGLPIKIGEKDKYKLIFLDVGLYLRFLGLDKELLLNNEDFTFVNKGTITEQVVGQELLTYKNQYEEGYLSYWARDKKSSTAEVDYLIQYNDKIFPIEVKSGKTGRLKSLKLYIEEKKIPFGIRISGNNISLNDNVLSIPLYMVGQLERLIGEAMNLSAF